MGRPKKVEAVSDVEEKSDTAKVEAVLGPSSAKDLIEEHNKVDEYIKAETKRFGEFMAPWKARQEAIENQLLDMLNQQGANSFKTDSGTAYKSKILQVSVSAEGQPYTNRDGDVAVGKDALLDFSLDHWSEIGSDLLMVSPQKDAVKRWMEEKGTPPPGVKTGWFTRVNIRRS